MNENSVSMRPCLPPLLLLLLPLLLLAACTEEASRRADDDAAADAHTIPFRKDGTLDFLRDGEAYLTIDIEIAETDSARTRGLMQRDGLPERSGMLFRFQQERIQSFWMANTPLALDILFVDADSQIVDIAKYARPLSPDQIVSADPARYVVEVPAGFTDTHGITETDHVRWRRTDGEDPS
jgi:uncharacterized membrane protein (UPF0127 family)